MILLFSVAMRRLYAGSISYDATQEDITALFEPFGKITCLTISWDEERNHHKVSMNFMGKIRSWM